MKVIHLTVMVEVTDDAPDPKDWDWHGFFTHAPGVNGYSIIDTELRPFSSMEEDPSHHTKH